MGIRITDVAMATFYSTTGVSLGRWKKSKVKGLNERYAALKKYYTKQMKREAKLNTKGNDV